MALQMIDETLPVGPLQCNCRVLACPRTGEALVVDPGDEPERILRTLHGLRTASGAAIQAKFLFHTHAHFDHCGATRKIVESMPGAEPKIALHPKDEPIYNALKMQGQLFGFHMEDPLPITHRLRDEETLQVGDLRFTVLHTPGHSPGGVCLRLHEDAAIGARETVFSGDTLFSGSIGRTDLWEGDGDLLFKSIRTRLFALDDETRVCPGHGPETRIGVEKRDNPFFR